MILGLSNVKVLGAIVVALCISFAFTFVTVPHPVEVPKQVITPVPTPPPVVITEQPTPAPVQPSGTISLGWRETTSNINSQVQTAMRFMGVMLIFMPIVYLLMFLLRVSQF